ncbi:MAG: hypothetical protein ACEPOZ_20010 [Marinifilaceae bacterium]
MAGSFLQVEEQTREKETQLVLQVDRMGLFANDREVMEGLFRITGTKYFRCLRYLSEKHDNATMKLRMVLCSFSFFFLVRGKSCTHFVWETLNTQKATYVWIVEKQQKGKLKLCLKKVETMIRVMNEHGKQSFVRIWHDYSHS